MQVSRPIWRALNVGNPLQSGVLGVNRDDLAIVGQRPRPRVWRQDCDSGCFEQFALNFSWIFVIHIGNISLTQNGSRTDDGNFIRPA